MTARLATVPISARPAPLNTAVLGSADCHELFAEENVRIGPRPVSFGAAKPREPQMPFLPVGKELEKSLFLFLPAGNRQGILLDNRLVMSYASSVMSRRFITGTPAIATTVASGKPRAGADEEKGCPASQTRDRAVAERNFPRQPVRYIPQL